jgi:hypothetical protein
MMADRDGPPRATLLETVQAVGASFFGVRGGRAHEQDMKRLNPIVVIGVGLGLAAAFVVTLILIVRAVVK